jgi:hypothetical protein
MSPVRPRLVSIGPGGELVVVMIKARHAGVVRLAGSDITWMDGSRVRV